MACGNETASTDPNGSADAPFILKQGRNFGLVVTVREREDGPTIDLLSPSRTGRAQLRRQAGEAGTPVATFVVTIRSPQTGSDRGRADVTLDASTSAATASPVIAPGLYVADVEFANDSDAGDVLATDVFHIRVVPEVTT